MRFIPNIVSCIQMLRDKENDKVEFGFISTLNY